MDQSYSSQADESGRGGRVKVFIREPRESELPLCRALLPRASSRPAARYFRLAFLSGDEILAGALSYRDDAVALGGLALHVIPPLRRKGIGTELVEYAAEQAREFDRHTLLSDVDLAGDREAAGFFIAQGFSKAGTITYATIGIQDLRSSMEATRERLQAAGQKSSIRALSLDQAPKQDIMRLYAEHITHLDPLPGLREHIRLDEATESIALMIGDQLAGFLLARLDAGVLHIPAWVVDPKFRGQQIGYALLAQLAERLRGRVDRLQFEFTDAAIVTSRMLEVPGCRIIKIAARFTRSLSGVQQLRSE